MSVPALEVVDWIEFRIFSATQDFMYARNNAGRKVVRIDKSGVAQEMLFDFTTATPVGMQLNPKYLIQDIYTAPTVLFPEQIFVSILDDNPDTTINNRSYLFRSVDGGDTFGNDAQASNGNFILALGWDDNQAAGEEHTRMVSTLPRGFCHAKINGQDKYILGEYNVSEHVTTGYRVAGGHGDRVRIMSSTDGYTWVQNATFNTVLGVRNTLHCHVIKQDPWSLKIFFGFGDTDLESGILIWDGTSFIPSNLAISAINLSGVRGYSGTQRYRFCDIIFPPNSNLFLTITDSISSNAERGIWGWSKTAPLSATSPARVDSKIINHAFASGYLMLQTPTGYIASEMLESGNSDYTIYIYTSADALEWDVTAMYKCKIGSGANNFSSLFWFDDHIYMGSSDQAGKQPMGTSKVKWDGVYKKQNDVELKILHPVYWVGDHGKGSPVDSAQQYSNGDYTGGKVSMPWATLKFALTGGGGDAGKLPVGARVLLPKGEHTEHAGILTNYGIGYLSGTGKITIEGFGSNVTILSFASDTPDEYAIYHQALNITPLRFQNMAIIGNKQFVDAMTVRQALSLRYVRCCVEGVSPARTFDLTGGEGALDLGSSLIGAATVICVDCDEATQTLAVNNCIFKGGAKQIYLSNNPNVSVTHSAFIDYTAAGIAAGSAQTDVSGIKNCIFMSSISAATPFLFDAIILDEISFSMVDKKVHTNARLADSSIVDINAYKNVTPDSKLISTSPCIDKGAFIAGVNMEGQLDPWGRKVHSIPNIGADQGAGAPKSGSRQIMQLGSNRGFFS